MMMNGGLPGPSPRTIMREPYGRQNYGPNDGGNTCFGMPVCCMDDVQPQLIQEQQWTYVGAGRGTHHLVPEYVYVGNGAGSWAREEKYFPDPRSYRCLWILAGLASFCLALLISIGLAALLSQSGVGDWLSHAGHHVHGHLSNAGTHIGNAAHALHGHIKKHAPGVIEHVKNGAGVVAHHVGNAAKTVHGKVKEHAPGVWEHVKNHSVAAGHAIHGAVKEHGPGVWENVKKGSSAAAHHAGNAARATHGAIQEHGPGVVEGIKNGASSITNQAGQAAAGAQSGTAATVAPETPAAAATVAPPAPAA